MRDLECQLEAGRGLEKLCASTWLGANFSGLFQLTRTFYVCLFGDQELQEVLSKSLGSVSRHYETRPLFGQKYSEDTCVK